ncbi:MAG: recombination regulator RecX [Treponema sp.]|jgi:regulatory protein|nr:recombination regulator RecX [Treponema sp.]
MIIISIKSSSSADIRRIELSDGSIFSYKVCYLPPDSPDAVEGIEINSAEEEGFRFASGCLRAEKAALQLIARAEQNTFGLSRKLEKRGHSSACTHAVISQLCETGLLDDRRYGRLWLESRICRQASSPRRLFAALCARIDRHDAEAVLKETLNNDEAEQELLKRYAQKLRRKFETGDEDPAARRTFRYALKSEGFSSQAIQIFFEE